MIINQNARPAQSRPLLYSCYQDGTRFKESQINKTKKYVLQFQIYEDGMSITNPFSANSSIHSSSMFYFSLLNVPVKY
jgi:hypothetical protein